MTRRTWVYVGFAGVVLVSMVLGWRPMYSPDVGFYLDIGRSIVETGAIPHVDELTFTRAGTPVLHAPWLFCVATWAAYALGGANLLIVLAIAGQLAAMALALHLARLRTGSVGASTVLLLFAFAVGSNWEYRPHVASWIFLLAILVCLQEHERGRSGWLWGLPLVQALWVNVHSLFVLGLAVISIHIVGRALARRGIDRRLLAFGTAAAGASFLTPYFRTVASYPWLQLKILSGSIVKSDVVGTAEFLSPFRLDYYTSTGHLVLWQPVLFVQLSFALVALGVVFGWRRYRATDWILLGAFGYLYHQALKNHGYFALATLPAAALGLSTLAAALGRSFKPWPTARRRLAALAMLVVPAACVVIAIQVANGYWYGNQRAEHRLGGGFNERILPVRASEFLRSSYPQPHRILNNWDSGGYLRFATRWPVFIDGRNEIMGDAFYREYLRFKSLATLPEMLAKRNLAIAVVPSDDLPEWLYYFDHTPGWRWVYRDDRHTVFATDAVTPELPALGMPRAGVDYPSFTTEEADGIRNRAQARRLPSMFTSIATRHHAPLRELSQSLLFLRTDNPSAAIGQALAGLRDSTFPAPELFATLGHAYYDIKDGVRAAECYRVALRSIEDPLARERLRKLEAR